jgi:hypothetical protein
MTLHNHNTKSIPSIGATTYLGVGLVSAAVLVFELTLTRVFAVAQFYHFAFMAISLALLGSGASGSLLSMWRRRAHPAALAAGFGLMTLGSYLVVNYVEFDPYTIASDWKQVPLLAANFLSAAVPFTLAGMIVGQLLEADARGAHRVYAANLVGSAAGCVAVLPALEALGGEGTVLLAALLGLLAAGAFLARGISPLPPGEGPGVRARRWAWLALGACAMILVAWMLARPDFMALRLSKYKGLVAVLRAPGAEHTFSAWNAVARVDVVESRSIHSLQGLSMNGRVSPPLQAGVTLDGDNLMAVTALAPEDPEAVELAGWLPLALPFELRPGGETLVIEPGGGFDVLVALSSGAARVTVAENNALLIEVVGERYADFTGGLYADPRVQVVNEDGRAFAHRARERFDVVDVALTDTFRPVTSGAYSLAENYQYTVEAFVDYLARLEDDGLLFVMRWLQTPPSESARALGVIAEALRRTGAERPTDHIAAYRSPPVMAFLVGRQPLSDDEVEAVRAFAEWRHFDLVLLPGLRPEEVNRYAVLPEPWYHNTFSDILANGPAVWDAYEYEISPTTDDRPFFYHYFRWGQTQQVIETLGMTWQPFGGSGYLVLLVLLVLVGVTSAVLIFGPLAVRRARMKNGREGVRSGAPAGLRARTLAYFSFLGLAFLFVEVPLAQRFIVFVGYPITALAVVLFAVLLFSGLGSLTAPRWRLPVALGALVAVILVYPVLLPAVFETWLGSPLWARVLISVGVLAPLGVLLGVPFAGGLALVEALAPGLTPWVWAINGCASVVSAILAVMLAISWGFSAVLWLGAACYAGALVTIWGLAGAHKRDIGRHSVLAGD